MPLLRVLLPESAVNRPWAAGAARSAHRVPASALGRTRWAAGAARSAHRVPGVPPPLPMGETLISHYYILNEPSFEIFLSRGGLSE